MIIFIRASVESLQMDDKPTEEDYKEMSDIVKDSAERLIDIVEGLLSLNTITDEAEWEQINVRQIFDVIISDLKNDIMQKELTVDLSGDCYMKGDKTLLERALFNLVHNAVRYNIDGGKVTITLSEDNIIIEDSGVGIGFENLTHLFEPFYCVDKSRSKKLGGHGLGMTIAKNILDRHDIDIAISSEPQKGTKIILSKQNM